MQFGFTGKEGTHASNLVPDVKQRSHRLVGVDARDCRTQQRRDVQGGHLWPVRLWHGKKDRTFSCRVAEDLAARLPNCKLQLVEGAGHYSMPIRHVREILADLLQVGNT